MPRKFISGLRETSHFVWSALWLRSYEAAWLVIYKYTCNLRLLMLILTCTIASLILYLNNHLNRFFLWIVNVICGLFFTHDLCTKKSTWPLMSLLKILRVKFWTLRKRANWSIDGNSEWNDMSLNMSTVDHSSQGYRVDLSCFT